MSKSLTSSRFAFQNTTLIIPVSRDLKARYGETGKAFQKCSKLRDAYHKSTPVLGQTKVYSFGGQTYVLACIHENYNDKPLAGHITQCLNDLEAKVARGTKGASLSFAMYPLGCRTTERISFLESMAAINASALATNCATSSKNHLTIVVSPQIEVAYNAWAMRQPVEGQAQPQQPRQNAFAKAAAHVAASTEERGLALLNSVSVPFLPEDCTDTGLINEVEQEYNRLEARLRAVQKRNYELNPTGSTSLSFTEGDQQELLAIITQSTSELQHDILFEEFCNRKLEAKAAQKSNVIYL